MWHVPHGQPDYDLVLSALLWMDMKRDMELCRAILFALEAQEDPEDYFDVEETFPNHPLPVVMRHLMILSQAGLIDIRDDSSVDEICYQPIGLTWQGHEFLDAVRSDTVWNKVKETAEEKGGSIPFDIMKDLAISFAKIYFGVE
jgi:hypothetical protein